MTEFAHPATEYGVVEGESAELVDRNLRIGSQLWSSATAFFFFAFLFAFFYLRSLNESHLWKPKNVTPPTTLGTLTAACVVAAAVLLTLALRDHRNENRRAWRIKGAVSIALLTAAIVLQIVAWSTEGFGPTDGGYASVYIGWTGLEVLFLLGLLYWLETTLATSLRYRSARLAPGDASGDAHRTAHDIDDPLSLIRGELTALSFYANVLALIAAITWFLLFIL
ncbi:MAG TPA: cytochrome c oxidase subunit 3 [Gaiellaceae bacterium]